MIFQNDHAKAQLYFERRTRTTFSRILGFLIALFIVSGGGHGFGAWADWEKNDGRTPDGIQDYLGIRSKSSIIEHTAMRVEVVEGRMRMFRRMYGNDPVQWTVQQRQYYSQLNRQKQEYVVQYQQLSLRYAPYDPDKTAAEFNQELVERATTANAIQ